MQFVPDRLLIFAKAPVPGRVKTRLMPELGADGAAALQVALLEQLLSELEEFDLHLACAPDAAHPLFSKYEWPKFSQAGQDLGDRMHQAFTSALCSARHVVLVGSDCPGIDSSYVHAAFTALRRVDVVLGPVEDGGYALIGLKQSQPGLFRGISWSTAMVYRQTLGRIAELGLTAHSLPRLWDVDDASDLERLKKDYPAIVAKSVR